MLNNKEDKLKYINKLEKENKMLRKHNLYLQKIIFADYKTVESLKTTINLLEKQLFQTKLAK